MTEQKLTMCRCGHRKNNHSEWWTMCLEYCDCQAFKPIDDTDLHRLIADLKELPAHSAIRFSHDGRSESYPMERFHQLASIAASVLRQ